MGDLIENLYVNQDFHFESGARGILKVEFRRREFLGQNIRIL